MSKCNKNGCCKTLTNRLGDGGKGFKAEDVINLKNRRTRFLGVAYKTSAKDIGVMLNWCPFCGGKPGDFELSLKLHDVAP